MMYFSEFTFFFMLHVAFAVRPQNTMDSSCSKTDLTSDNYYVRACSESPESYCPGREVDEDEQGEIFMSFLATLYGEKNAGKAFETHVDLNIIEHDPNDTQNRDDIVARLSEILAFANFSVLASSFSNNIGLAHLRLNQDPEPAALADIYRMEGTCIVEHWDVTQYRPANSTNPIAMF
ncbi:hypothetical protein N7493_008106 [Penicillium malachiteum]|uniref:Uncharacterized protein n=1 Tax=Penicillium malachiteum TaxID=1324776 RepID=A0AAD6HGQ0_9EURO|nr:hypothetical protein N7493_008106 [Penicillium malachiteum]